MAGREADGRAHHADQHALKHEDATDLRLLRPHGHQDSDVAVLLHHHHDQRDEDIQRRHQHDEADGYEGHRALHIQRVQDVPVLLHPRGCLQLRADDPVHLAGHFRRLVDVVQFKLDAVDHVFQALQSLRGSERCVCPGGIDLEEAGFEQAHHAKTLRGRPRPEGRQLTLRAHHGDGAADARAHRLRQAGPENDAR